MEKQLVIAEQKRRTWRIPRAKPSGTWNPTNSSESWDTAIDEFASHGFKEASLNRLVQKVGIAKGSIFQYFGTKEKLFGFIFDHAVNLVRHYASAGQAERPPGRIFS